MLIHYHVNLMCLVLLGQICIHQTFRAKAGDLESLVMCVRCMFTTRTIATG